VWLHASGGMHGLAGGPVSLGAILNASIRLGTFYAR
jgi:hypothetical protein